jgi:hypothetical protein
MRLLFRAMKPGPDGFPIADESPRTLGSRLNGEDIPVSRDGNVEQRTGGMSVSPDDPTRLPWHRRPPEWGGTGKDPVYQIEAEALGRELVYRPDPDDPQGHGFVEPVRWMPFEEYQRALWETRREWTRVTKE